MSEVMFDPADPSKAFIGSAAAAPFGFQVGAATMVNIHPATRCEGRPCVMHNPSEHHMRGWRLNWRGDSRLMERLCPHGIGHPDPDDLTYWDSRGMDFKGVHGCDGCCRGER